MNTAPTNRLTEAALNQFTGDLERYRHPVNGDVIYTPGVQFVANEGDAYWLIDAIAYYLLPSKITPHIEKDPRIQDLHFWKLTVLDDRSVLLQARVDSPCEPFIQHVFESKGFPLNSVQIWAGFDGIYWTLYLPSEH